MPSNHPAKNLIPSIFFLILVLPSTVFCESVGTKVQEGISRYQEGNFKDATKKFSGAHADRPEDSRIAYNLGNAYFKEGKFQEALQAYTQSVLDEKNPDIQKKSIYNTGNTMVKLGKLKEAEAAYKKTLALDPGDMDAKYNLEFVRQQLKNPEEKKQDPGQNQQKDQQENQDNEKGQADNQKPNDSKDQQKGDQQPPPENADSEKNEPGTSDQPEKTPMEAEISKEKAEQLLEGLTEDLKNISRLQAGKSKSAYQGNDW
jgi:tetratricopeptide (TPR) repeat protein